MSSACQFLADKDLYLNFRKRLLCERDECFEDAALAVQDMIKSTEDLLKAARMNEGQSAGANDLLHLFQENVRRRNIVEMLTTVDFRIYHKIFRRGRKALSIELQRLS